MDCSTPCTLQSGLWKEVLNGKGEEGERASGSHDGAQKLSKPRDGLHSFHHGVHPWWVLQLSDPAEGAHTGGGGAPVSVVVVLAAFQEVLLPLEVGLLVQGPGAICHHAGVDVAELECLRNRWAVLSPLGHLTSEILLIVKPDLPGISINLEIEQGQDVTIIIGFHYI